jgi:hypothetical protein
MDINVATTSNQIKIEIVVNKPDVIGSFFMNAKTNKPSTKELYNILINIANIL